MRLRKPRVQTVVAALLVGVAFSSLSLADTLRFRGTDYLEGKVVSESFELRASYGIVRIPMVSIRKLVFPGGLVDRRKSLMYAGAKDIASGEDSPEGARTGDATDKMLSDLGILSDGSVSPGGSSTLVPQDMVVVDTVRGERFQGKIVTDTVTFLPSLSGPEQEPTTIEVKFISDVEIDSKDETPAKDMVLFVMRNGDEVLGHIESETIKLATPWNEKLEIETAVLQTIEFSGNEPSEIVVKVNIASGGQVTGVLDDETIQVRTQDDCRLDIARSTFRFIRFGRPVVR